MRWIRQIWDYLGESNHRGRLALVMGAIISVVGFISLPEIPPDCEKFQEWPWEGSSKVSERIIEQGYEEIANRRGLFISEIAELSRTGDGYQIALCARSALNEVNRSLLKSDLAYLAVALDVNSSLGLEEIERYIKQSLQANAKNPYALILRAYYESALAQRNYDGEDDLYSRIKANLRGLGWGEYWSRQSLEAEETPEGFDAAAHFKASIAAAYYTLCDYTNYASYATGFVELTHEAEEKKIKNVGPLDWPRRRELFIQRNPEIEELLKENRELTTTFKKIETRRKSDIASYRSLPKCPSQ